MNLTPIQHHLLLLSEAAQSPKKYVTTSLKPVSRIAHRVKTFFLKLFTCGFYKPRDDLNLKKIGKTLLSNCQISRDPIALEHSVDTLFHLSKRLKQTQKYEKSLQKTIAQFYQIIPHTAPKSYLLPNLEKWTPPKPKITSPKKNHSKVLKGTKVPQTPNTKKIRSQQEGSTLKEAQKTASDFSNRLKTLYTDIEEKTLALKQIEGEIQSLKQAIPNKPFEDQIECWEEIKELQKKGSEVKVELKPLASELTKLLFEGKSIDSLTSEELKPYYEKFAKEISITILKYDLTYRQFFA